MGTRRSMHHYLASNASAPFHRRSPDVERQLQTNSTLFRNVIGQPIMQPGTMASWSGGAEPSLPPAPPPPGLVETLFPPHAGGSSKISGPMLGGAMLFSSSNEGRRDSGLRTVSLRAAAAEQERQREERKRGRVSMQLGQSSIETPGSFSREYSVRRKPVTPGPREREREQQYVDPRTSAFTYSTEDDEVATQYTYPQGGLAPADQRVLFVNSIEYDNPSLVQSIVTHTPTNPEKAHTTGRYTVTATTGILRRSPLYEASEDESPTLPVDMTPVIARKRPAIPDRNSNPRAIFPSGRSPRQHDRNRSVSSRKSTRSQEEGVPPLPAPPQPVMKKKQKQAPPPVIITALNKSASGPPRSAVNGPMSLQLPVTPALPTPYETAKAWVESMAPVIKNSGPVLVDISASRESTLKRSTSDKSKNQSSPIPAIPVMPAHRPMTARKSSTTLAWLGTDVVDTQQEEHHLTESVMIELQNTSDPEADEGEGSAPSLTTAASSRSSPKGPRQRGSFPSPPSVEPGDHDSDFPADTAPSPSSPGSGSIIFSDMEDGTELLDMHQYTQQQQNFLKLPQNFRFGDPIPAFSSTFRGQRRKQPPAPLGVVPLRTRFPRPPTLLQPPARQQAPNNRDSLLLMQLEQEASVQENQWRDMRRTLVIRDSFVSGGSARVSRAMASATTGGWQKQLAEAQLAYMSEAPILAQLVEELNREKIEPLELGEELRSEEEEVGPLTFVEESAEEVEATPLQPTVYFSHTLSLVDDSEDEDDVVHTSDMDMMEWEMISATPRAPHPSLWCAPVILPHIPSASYLWSSGYRSDSAAQPAALTLRPRKRYDRGLSSLESSRLWAKASPSRIDGATGLWKDRKAWRPKSSLRKRDNTMKKHRVTWVEEVVTGLLLYPRV